MPGCPPPQTLLLPGAVFPGANSAEASQPSAPRLWAPAAHRLGWGGGGVGNNTAGGSSPRSGRRWGWTLLRPVRSGRWCPHHVLTCPSAPRVPGGSLPPTRPPPLGWTPPLGSFSCSHKFSHSGAGLCHMNLGGGEQGTGVVPHIGFPLSFSISQLRVHPA